MVDLSAIVSSNPIANQRRANLVSDFTEARYMVNRDMLLWVLREKEPVPTPGNVTINGVATIKFKFDALSVTIAWNVCDSDSVVFLQADADIAYRCFNQMVTGSDSAQVM